MRVIQVSVDIVITDDRTCEDIESEFNDIANKNDYLVVGSNVIDISDYYNSYDASDKELQEYCITEWHNGHCKECPYNDRCNAYIRKYGTTPLETFGE